MPSPGRLGCICCAPGPDQVGLPVAAPTAFSGAHGLCVYLLSARAPSLARQPRIPAPSPPSTAIFPGVSRCVVCESLREERVNQSKPV